MGRGRDGVGFCVVIFVSDQAVVSGVQQVLLLAQAERCKCDDG